MLEKESEKLLINWFKEKGKNITNIYLNRKNDFNTPVFNISGEITTKPDILFTYNNSFNENNVIIEVKNCNSSRNIHDSGKILDYYKNYILNKTKYIINEQEIKIDYFVVATEESLKGKLFIDDTKLIDNSLMDDTQRNLCIKFPNLVPRYEYQRTSDYLRGLWSEWRRIKKEVKKEHEKLPGVGILMNSPELKTNPYLFVQSWIDYLQTKPQWRQRFIQL